MTSQRGLALAVSLLITALALTAITTYLVIATQNAGQDQAAYLAEQGYQAADAGLAMAVAACSRGREYDCVGWSGWNAPNQPYHVNKDGGDPTVTLGIQAEDNSHNYIVTATGQESLPPGMGGSGRGQRVLRARIRFNGAQEWLGATYLGSA